MDDPDRAAASHPGLLLFPAWSKEAMEILEKQGKRVEYVEITGDGGHLDGVLGVKQKMPLDPPGEAMEPRDNVRLPWRRPHRVRHACQSVGS